MERQLVSKKFTSNMQPPAFGQKIGLKSPILDAYSTSQNSTRGVVTEFVDMGANAFDRCVVNFRGRSIRATCCHPGLAVGSSVCMIEQPRGIWYATVLQKSWYSRPLTDLLDKGKPVQAAVEWLLSFGAKWQPRLIFIDKRGVFYGDLLDVLNLPINPATGKPYTDEEFFGEFGTGGFFSPGSWPFDPYLFGTADTDGDGKVNQGEFLTFMGIFKTPNKVTKWPVVLEASSAYASVGSFYNPPTDPDQIAQYYKNIATLTAELTVIMDNLNKQHKVYYYTFAGGAGWLPIVYEIVVTNPPYGQAWTWLGTVQCTLSGPAS